MNRTLMQRSKAHGQQRLFWVVALLFVMAVVAGIFWLQGRGTRTGRNEHAGVRTVNLASYYNAGVTNSTLDPATNDGVNNLAAFPTGIMSPSGIRFLTEGVIQLACKDSQTWSNHFPDKVEGIEIGLKVREIHILHGTGFWAEEGKPIAALILHYENGSERRIPIVYGRHVRDWWQSKGDPRPDSGSEIIWFGKNPAAQLNRARLRIYKSSFQNPLPDVTVQSIDYVSTLTLSAPFMLAMSIE